MVVTQYGRVIKTLGLLDNVLELTQLQHDPLIDSAHIHEGEEWVRVLRWSERGQPLSIELFSTFTRGNDEVLTVLGRRITCQVWYEHVKANEPSTSWENTFWVEVGSGRVRKSRQMIAPHSPFVELTILKPAL